MAIDQIRTGSLAAVLSAEGDHDGAAALLEELIADLDRRGQARAAVTPPSRSPPSQERAARRMAAERSLAVGAVPLSSRGPAAARPRRRPGGRGGAGQARGARRVGSWPGTGPPSPRASWPSCSRTPRRRAGRRDAADLNARELAILRMLDVGRSNQQIARALGVTVNTVKWYLKNIYAKLGATNRAEAVSTARRGGLLS